MQNNIAAYITMYTPCCEKAFITWLNTSYDKFTCETIKSLLDMDEIGTIFVSRWLALQMVNVPDVTPTTFGLSVHKRILIKLLDEYEEKIRPEASAI